MQSLKVKDVKAPEFQEDLNRFLAYMKWKREDVENLPLQTYLKLLTIELEKNMKDLEQLLKKANP